MTSCDQPTGVLPFAEAITRLLEQITPIIQYESRPIEAAANCVLAADIKASQQVPAYDNSAMDGFALGAVNVAEPSCFIIVGRVLAGETFSAPLKSGEAVRIMTGAKVPQGTYAVVMQENTTSDNDKVYVETPPKYQDNIRYAGEDIDIGAIVFAKGERLDPIKIGMLASLGIAEVPVFTPLCIGLFATGDEIVQPGNTLQDGQIFDTNSFLLKTALTAFGCSVRHYGILPDNLRQIERALATASTEVDVLITSGGVSVGTADFVKTALNNLGQINFWKVAMKPGKPFAFGQMNSCLFFGLPGNPVSSAITLQMLVLPALAKRQGANLKPQTVYQGTLRNDIKKRPGRMDFQRGFANPTLTGVIEIDVPKTQGSALLSRLDSANVLLLLEQDSGSLKAGDSVQFIPIHPVLQGQF